MKPFIGIKQIWYGEALSEAPTAATIKTIISKLTEVKNSHDGTFSYEQDDPETTEYVNELTGQTYYVDKTSDGSHTINFTVGVYDFADKIALQGGDYAESASKTGWKNDNTNEVIYKCIVAKTKTGNFIVFTNAAVIAKADTQEKNVGLGVKATAMENENSGVASEYWFDGSGITL